MSEWKEGELRCIDNMRNYINELEAFIREDKGVYSVAPLIDEWKRKKENKNAIIAWNNAGQTQRAS